MSEHPSHFNNRFPEFDRTKRLAPELQHFLMAVWPKEIHNINQKLDKIMSAITDFANSIKPIIQKASDDIGTLVTDLTNQQTAITALTAQIAALQGSVGGSLSPEDSQALADVLTNAQALQTSADTAVSNAQSVTAPVVPEAPAT